MSSGARTGVLQTGVLQRLCGHGTQPQPPGQQRHQAPSSSGLL